MDGLVLWHAGMSSHLKRTGLLASNDKLRKGLSDYAHMMAMKKWETKTIGEVVRAYEAAFTALEPRFEGAVDWPAENEGLLADLDLHASHTLEPKGKSP